MPLVHFSIHRYTTEPEELDEQALARLVASDAGFVASLCELDAPEGALVIGDAEILDDLSSATQRLCFEAVTLIAAPGANYEYPHFTSNAHARLVSSADGTTISLSGNYLPTCTFARAELFPALYACGLRYLAFLEQLGHRGRTFSAADLTHLRPFAERAAAALAAQGLA